MLLNISAHTRTQVVKCDADKTEGRLTLETESEREREGVEERLSAKIKLRYHRDG